MKKAYYTKAEIDSKKTYNQKIADVKLLVVKAVFLGSIAFTSFSAKAQEAWSLVQCIDYALQNNIALNIADNNTGKQQINFRESKAKLLPTLNMGSGVSMNFGRNIDGNTNTITFDQTLSNNYWISSSIDLFQGLVKYNAIGFNKYLLSATKEEADYIKNKLVFDVLTAYYTVLYSKGLRNVAQSQVTLSEMQLKRMQKLVDVGRESPITVQELKSQWASDMLSLTQSQNMYNKTLGELKQLLRLDVDQSFSIGTINLDSFVETPIQDIDSLFNVAITLLPEIKQQEYLYKASIKDLAIAKGGISPRIYMSAGYYTGYFNRDPLPFNNQIIDNQNQAINMGI
ncbi:MAG: TolC family protein, partial [Bacteroidales bacterium]|nr:TolC family protein [Bacteroidales bacterium]